MKATKHLRRRHVLQHGKHTRAPVPASGAPVRASARAVESEIKLAVPEGAWEGLVHEMSSGPDSRRVALHAIYHDTPGGDLASAGISLRVRHDGARWVQTLKAPGPNAIERVEDEVTVGRVTGDGAPPPVDLMRHRSIAAKEALRTALGVKDGDPMPATQPVFEVKVDRRVRRVALGDSIIELALDEGQLLASGRTRMLRELELELVEGDVSDLLALARLWRARWGLWLSTSSKAARGLQLASGDLYGAPVAARAPRLPSKPGMGQFTAAVLDSCLHQVMGNVSELAAGSQADEHVHQARVGIRRLRTALRELPTLAGDSERFEPVLVDVFRALGERRDRTHVLRDIEPLVEAAGGRPLRVPPQFHEGPDPGKLVRSGEFQDALLGLLARAEQARMSPPEPGVRKAMRSRLSRLQKQVTRDGRRFTRLEEDHQHRERKRLKRLRYLGEFVAPLFPKDDAHRYFAQIKPAQDALGHYYDQIMAQKMFEELLVSDPGARFGVEWLQARRPAQAKACRRSLRALASTDGFWKKR